MSFDFASDADLALQKAIFECLTTDAGVSEFVGSRIYDAVPGDTGFPYLTLGEAQVDDWSAGEAEGREHWLSLNVYSRSGGRAEAKAIMGAVHRALHDAELTLDGFALINMRFQSAETRRESDGATWRGTIRFRAVTEPLSE
ncbi:MAG: DUF3168 domain-containing protein [Parvibaculum sp.]|nr:DUF3168 domain-containing protein [Parvibaculum sp.]